MITNAEHDSWPGDILIPDAVEKGLITESKIRTAKVAPVEASSATLISRLDRKTYAKVHQQLQRIIG